MLKSTPNKIEKDGVILVEKIAPKIKEEDTNTYSSGNNYYSNQNNERVQLTEEQKEEKKESNLSKAIKKAADKGMSLNEYLEENTSVLLADLSFSSQTSAFTSSANTFAFDLIVNIFVT